MSIVSQPARLVERGFAALASSDAALMEILAAEQERQQRSLMMIASCSIADPSVLACQSSAFGNLTTEGYPGARFHAGCEHADELERLAIERAKSLFGATYANVQPHSGSSANELIMFAVLKPGDGILGLDLACGGHLTHGAAASVSGSYFKASSYGVDQTGRIDMANVESVALQARPKLIVAGASAYPRTIDFPEFRRIADRVGALLLADISHIAGLVASGIHPSPINFAHFTTTSTYKQLGGPRGGLILMGTDAAMPNPNGKGTLADAVQRAVFPYFQGTPALASIAAKARAFGIATKPAFSAWARRIVEDASALAKSLLQHGYTLVTGGTDNHMVLVDLRPVGLTGRIAEQALERCGIIVNKNRVPGDESPAQVTSGIRLGTNTLAAREMGTEAMATCAEIIHRVLRAIPRDRHDDAELVPDDVRKNAQKAVAELCDRYPLPGYVEPGGLSEHRLGEKKHG